MALPPTVRVKLSSEAAEAISLTPVVVQELAVRDLIEHVLGVAGKDEARLCEILLRGTLVSGASRFRWTGWEADVESVRLLLAAFPDPDPARAFTATQCTRVVLRGPRQPIVIPREAAARGGILDTLLHRRSFWDELMSIVAAATPRYAAYSYRDRADVFNTPLTAQDAQRIRNAARLIRYTALQAQVKNTAIESVELYVVRA